MTSPPTSSDSGRDRVAVVWASPKSSAKFLQLYFVILSISERKLQIHSHRIGHCSVDNSVPVANPWRCLLHPRAFRLRLADGCWSCPKAVQEGKSHAGGSYQELAARNARFRRCVDVKHWERSERDVYKLPVNAEVLEARDVIRTSCSWLQSRKCLIAPTLESALIQSVGQHCPSYVDFEHWERSKCDFFTPKTIIALRRLRGTRNTKNKTKFYLEKIIYLIMAYLKYSYEVIAMIISYKHSCIDRLKISVSFLTLYYII